MQSHMDTYYHKRLHVRILVQKYLYAHLLYCIVRWLHPYMYWCNRVLDHFAVQAPAT